MNEFVKGTNELKYTTVEALNAKLDKSYGEEDDPLNKTALLYALVDGGEVPEGDEQCFQLVQEMMEMTSAEKEAQAASIQKDFKEDADQNNIDQLHQEASRLRSELNNGFEMRDFVLGRIRDLMLIKFSTENALTRENPRDPEVIARYKNTINRWDLAIASWQHLGRGLLNHLQWDLNDYPQLSTNSKEVGEFEAILRQTALNQQNVVQQRQSVEVTT